MVRWPVLGVGVMVCLQRRRRLRHDWEESVPRVHDARPLLERYFAALQTRVVAQRASVVEEHLKPTETDAGGLFDEHH